MQKNKQSNQKKAQKALKPVLPKETYENFFKLGNCTHKYGLSLVDPFDGPAGACLPVSPSLLTRKVRSFSRFTLAVGTLGVGFVLANAQGMAGDILNAYTTTAAFAGTATSFVASAGVVGQSTNADTSLSSFSNAALMQLRVVSWGIRIRYRGTELNRGGRLLTLEEPDHQTMSGFTSNAFLAYEKCNEHAVTEKWTRVCMSGPVAPADYDFTGINLVHTSTPYMGVFVESTAGNLFDVEIFYNYELVGSVPRGKTASEADDMGVGAVVGTIREHNDSALDSKHPMVTAAGPTGQNYTNVSKVLQQTVNAYASQNTSGWLTKGAKLWKEAKPWLGKALNIAETVAPLLLL